MTDGDYLIHGKEKKTAVQVSSFCVDIDKSYNFNIISFLIGIDSIQLQYFACCTNTIAIDEIPGRKEVTPKSKQATFNLFLQRKDIESYFIVHFQHNNQYKGIPRYHSPLGAPPVLA